MQVLEIDASLKDAAEAIDAVSVVYFEETSNWVVAFDDDYPLFLAPLQRDGHWILFGPVADVVEEHKAAMDDLFMLYNGQAEQTGGFTVGVDEPQGMYKLSLLLGPSDLETARLAPMILQFQLCRRTWMEVVERWSPDDPPTAGDLPVNPGLRV